MQLGCSSFSWQTQDNQHWLARTCDMYLLPNAGPTFMPRGYGMAINKSGDCVATKLAYVGFSM